MASEILLHGPGSLEQRGPLCLRVVERVRRADVRDEDGDEPARLRERSPCRHGSRGGERRVWDGCTLPRDEVE